MSMRVRDALGVVSRVRDRLLLDVSASDDPDDKRYFSRTKQAFKDECDVNLIMKRFERTGMLDHLAQYQGSYGDFLNVPQSYHDAVNQVIAAQDMFMSLPAKVRARFVNDPGAFLAFVEDPANAEEMIALGLAKRRVEVESRAPEAPPEAGSPEG